MAGYVTYQATSRARKGNRRSSWKEKLRSLFTHRRVPAKRVYPQKVVTGVQRSWRWKRLFRNFALLGTMLMIVLFVAWSGARWVLSSNVFRLSDVRVTGERHVSERQILELAKVQVGGNLINFNRSAAKVRIESLPWVDHVDIKTHWPSSVEVLVTEHQPLALVNLQEGKISQLYYVDTKGQIFAKAEGRQEMDYPVITGVQMDRDVQKDTFLQNSLARGALQVLQVAARGNAVLPIQAISEVHVDAKEGLILYLVAHPFPVYFGTDRLQTKYYWLVRTIGELYAKKMVESVKEIRMDYIDDKILVTGPKNNG